MSGYDVGNRDQELLGEFDVLEARIADYGYHLQNLQNLLAITPQLAVTDNLRRSLQDVISRTEGKQLALRDALQRLRTPED